MWPADDWARTESRTGRLFPGHGQLPLTELVAAFPAGGALSVEAPVAAMAGRSVAERAARAFAAASKLIATTMRTPQEEAEIIQ